MNSEEVRKEVRIYRFRLGPVRYSYIIGYKEVFILLLKWKRNDVYKY